jgi:SLAP domain-containing protein
MNNIADMILSLVGEDSASPLKKLVYENELKDINERFPIKENEFDIKKTYLVKNENILEAGFFIRNGMKAELAFEQILVNVNDSSGNKIASRFIDFKGEVPIPTCSARHFDVSFKLRKDANLIEGEEYTISIGKSDNLEAVPSVITKIENMPINISFEEEKFIKDFADSLKTLKVDEFDINVYKLAYKNNGGIDCILLLRNGKDVIVSLANLPISIVDANDTVIARKVFENKKKLLNISPKEAKLLNLEFNMLEVPAEKYDLAKCKVIYK